MLDFLYKYQSKGVFSGACQPYLKGLLRCQTRKAVADLFLSAPGCEFICPVIAKGGITANDLMEDLGMFANGRYIYEDGYSSAFYVGIDSVIPLTTLATIVDCREVNIPAGSICELHIIGRTKITGKGAARIYNYNSDGTHYITKHGQL